ncbi:hypothetical protein [uncultured Bdellovibrio sp.]|uniref:hypothetical protein n=1 Tax=Bdellovibrio sp. HCB-162 TaxID=3394234 RepID=UPI0025DFA82F|nr:hypothetical protein [uncultured Bdellovibrio sp.]
MKRWILILSLISSPALADSLCYQSEGNPRTGKAFATDQDYQEELSRWRSQAPSTPNPFSLLKAYNVYSSEKAFANSMKSDKRAHCYMGCRISQSTNYKTADYVGWLKEERDLKDCNRNTHYDEEDYVATLRGATFGESQKDAKGCLQACEQVY